MLICHCIIIPQSTEQAAHGELSLLANLLGSAVDAKAAIKIDLFNDDFLMEPAKVSYCLMSLLIVFIAIVLLLFVTRCAHFLIVIIEKFFEPLYVVQYFTLSIHLILYCNTDMCMSSTALVQPLYA